MDIAALSMTLANIELGDRIGTAVLDKALESAEVAGASMIQMMDRSMELSVNPGIGGNFDISV
ncbi:MAG: YjfB family protein [Lachnospiraceae bacterium]|nr:YjfB family protein [Lachnospiraceae bacterium]